MLIGEIHKLGITDYSNLAMGRTQRPYETTFGSNMAGAGPLYKTKIVP